MCLNFVEHPRCDKYNNPQIYWSRSIRRNGCIRSLFWMWTLPESQTSTFSKMIILNWGTIDWAKPIFINLNLDSFFFFHINRFFHTKAGFSLISALKFVRLVFLRLRPFEFRNDNIELSLCAASCVSQSLSWFRKAIDIQWATS